MVGGNLCEESNDQDGNWRDYRMADEDRKVYLRKLARPVMLHGVSDINWTVRN